ncbi:MAG: hypothetical protein IJ055_04665 [Oscillospiraceae bacterium]|nr:hypothetical protein [Oscillospiraceae bacterium]
MRIGRVLRYILLSICLAAEALLALLCAGGLLLPSYDIDAGDDRRITLTVLLFSMMLGAVSVGGMVRQKAGKRMVLRTGAMMKLTVFCLFLTVLITVEPPLVLGASITFALMTLLTGAATAYIGLRSNAPVQEIAAHAAFPKFTEYNTANARSGVRRTYLELHRRLPESLTQEDEAAVNRYAAMPAAYLLLWLVHRGFMSERFRDAHKDPVQLIERDPAGYLAEEMDGVLRCGDITPELHPFLDRYFGADGWGQPRLYDLDTGAFLADHDRIVLEEGRLPLCTEFDVAHCRALEEQLDARLADWRDVFLAEDPVYVEEVFWALFGTRVELHAAPGVPEDYIERCKDHLLRFPRERMEQMAAQYADWEYVLPEGKQMLLDCFVPCRVEIDLPRGEEPAYRILGETDLDEEHGFSCTLRGELLLETAQYMDTASPWAPENRRRYAVFSALADVPRIGEQEALTLVSQGRLVRETLPDGRSVLLPPQALFYKRQSDAFLSALRRAGRTITHECTPMFRKDCPVPAALYIASHMGERCTFSCRLEILPPA